MWASAAVMLRPMSETTAVSARRGPRGPLRDADAAGDALAVLALPGKAQDALRLSVGVVREGSCSRCDGWRGPRRG